MSNNNNGMANGMEQYPDSNSDYMNFMINFIESSPSDQAKQHPHLMTRGFIQPKLEQNPNSPQNPGPLGGMIPANPHPSSPKTHIPLQNLPPHLNQPYAFYPNSQPNYNPMSPQHNGSGPYPTNAGNPYPNLNGIPNGNNNGSNGLNNNSGLSFNITAPSLSSQNLNGINNNGNNTPTRLSLQMDNIPSSLSSSSPGNNNNSESNSQGGSVSNSPQAINNASSASISSSQVTPTVPQMTGQYIVPGGNQSPFAQAHNNNNNNNNNNNANSNNNNSNSVPSSPSSNQGMISSPGNGNNGNSPVTQPFDPSTAPPTMTTSESPEQLLNQLYQMEQRQKEHIEKIRQYQKQVLLRPQKESFDILCAQQQQLKSQITEELKALSQLYQTVILPPSDIQKLLFLVQEITIQRSQLELFQKELQQLTINPQLTTPACALLVIEQPLPMVITKNKQLEDDPIIVQLLTGANVDIQSLSKVKVAMVCENHQVKSNSRRSIENDTQNMDPYRRVAKFYLKFLTGTRKNPVNLRFGIQLQLHNQKVTVESESTKPSIVITNECQWEESEGVLLKQDAFAEQLEVLWPQFANILQRHFIRATRQDLTRPTRSLLPFDLEYLHQQFFGGQRTVTQKAFDNFWTWFGKGVQKLRYQRHICPLWQSGLIFGFLTREGVTEILKDEEIGTFLIRFSERHPGLFAVGYKASADPDPKKAVRHYLIRPEDTAGAKKTLPDFLRSSTAFKQLLQVTGEIEGGKLKTRKFPRDVVLSPYYSKRNSFKGALGYDDELPNQDFI